MFSPGPQYNGFIIRGKKGYLMLDIKVTLTQTPKQKPVDESAL